MLLQSRRPRRLSSTANRTRRLKVESLERRQLLAAYVVDTATDVVSPGDGLVSLREAINAANASAGPDTIEFSPALNGQPLQIQIAGFDNNNASGDFDLTDDVSIIGNGINQTFIDGNQIDRVFHVLPGTNASFSDLTIQGGLARDDGYELTSLDRNENALGGGILLNDSEVLVQRSRVTGNVAAAGQFDYYGFPGSGRGGGIFALRDAELTVRDSIFNNNEARGDFIGGAGAGGAIGSRHINAAYIDNEIPTPVITIERTKIFGNRARGKDGGSERSGGSVRGGGLSMVATTVTIRESAITRNRAIAGDGGRGTRDDSGYLGGTALGGGVSIMSAPRAMRYATLFNTTISGNKAIGGNGGVGYSSPPTVNRDGTDGGDGGRSVGGGVFLSAGTTELFHVTIADNQAIEGSGGTGGESPNRTPGQDGLDGTSEGGGLSLTPGTLRASATLIADNHSLTAPDVDGHFSTATAVLVENPEGATGLTVIDGPNENIVGVDPQLEPLSSVGSWTAYHALPLSSPAVDAASAGEPVDQRGMARPQGHRFDIGAYEAPIGNVFVVNSTDDGGDTDLDDGVALDANGNTTLRAAIEQANALANLNGIPDTIEFNLPGSLFIQPGTILPTITDAAFINGKSQPGYAGTPIVQVDAANAVDFGLRMSGSGSVISGLSITGALNSGIDIGGSNNRLMDSFVGIDPNQNASPNSRGIRVPLAKEGQISGNVISGNARQGILVTPGLPGSTDDPTAHVIAGNMIGTNSDGTAAIPNGIDGVLLLGSGNIVQGNVISGNNRWGVLIDSHDNLLVANRIGTDATGAVAIPNDSGVVIRDSANQIGGSEPGLGNLISGNTRIGLSLFRTSRNIVQGNQIGTSADESNAIPNGSTGIQLTRSGDNQIGGVLAREGNTISGNGLHGVLITLSANNNEVVGNRIGVNSTGESIIANQGDGVRLVGANGNSIEENHIAGNAGRGVVVDGAGASNDILFNLIGTDSTGSSPMHNGPGGGVRVLSRRTTIENNTISAPDVGILAFRDATDAVIRHNWLGTDRDQTSTSLGMPTAIRVTGGADHALVESNVIANNEAGILVQHAVGVRITNNSIFDNSQMGIDLDADGVTPNDPLDSDVGANQRQNTPVLSRAKSVGSRIQFTYRVDSLRTNATYPMRIEFFVSDGNGQGKTLIGSDVYTGPEARRNKTVTITGVFIDVGEQVLATATDAFGNTSEFGDEFTVT